MTRDQGDVGSAGGAQAAAGGASTPLPERLLFFDGVCVLCQGIVQFLVRVDRDKRLRYASLQGESAERARRDHPAMPADLSTLVYLDGGRLYTRSRAVFRATGELPMPWKAASVLAYLPMWLTDIVYRCVAAVRYRVFGKSDVCMVPRPEERSLFLP